MNRRQFFGMTAAAVAAAGLPVLVLPEKTLFLPPRWGWKPSQLGAGYMREVEQYAINRDELLIRYDAVGRDIWGQEHQFQLEMTKAQPALAARIISDRFRHDGLIAIRPQDAHTFRLVLPRGFDQARYV